jgi:hypothetical protein
MPQSASDRQSAPGLSTRYYRLGQRGEFTSGAKAAESGVAFGNPQTRVYYGPGHRKIRNSMELHAKAQT